MDAQNIKWNEEHQIFYNIINSLPHYIFWKDKHFIFRGCNLNFAKQFGFDSTSDIIGKKDEELKWFGEHIAKYREDDAFVIKSGTPKLNYEEIQKQPNGDAWTVLVSKIPLYDQAGNVDGILGIYTNITERKYFERELYTTKVTESVNRAKTELIRNLSHDMRTPHS